MIGDRLVSENDDTLTLKACAERLGVHYMTAYRYVRLGMLPARKVGTEWQVSTSDLDRFQEAHDPSAGRRGRNHRDAPWASRLEGRLLAGDERGSWQVVEAAMASGADPATVYTDVIGPALSDIGDRWHDGELSIAQEHQATAIANRIVGRLSARFTHRGRTRGRVIIGTPPGEGHSIPVAMVADIFRGAGFSVVELGSDLPAESFVEAATAADGVTAIAVSVTNSAALDGIEALLAMLHDALDVPIVVGGRAIVDADHARALGADAYAANGSAAVEFVESLL